MNRLVYFFFLLCVSSIINSQSIGIGYGFSGTQNFGKPESTIDVSVLVDLNENVTSSISVSNWSGMDGNLRLSNSIIRGSFYGNVGIGISFFYKYYEANDFLFSFGIGLTQFEKIDNYYGLGNSSYSPAFSLTPLFVKYKLNETVSLFSKGTVSFSADYGNPNWGSLVIGIFVDPISMFK